MPFILLVLAAVAPSQSPEVEDLIRALGAEDVAERDRAERRLVELGIRGRAAVARAAKDANAEVSGRARRVLRAYPAAVRMEELYEAGFSRETAAAIHDFPQRIWSTDAAAAAGALRELARYAPGRSLIALASVFGREELPDEVRNAYADLMERFRAPELAPCVVPLLRSAHTGCRRRALETIAASRAAEATPDILPLLHDREWGDAAIETLAKLGATPPEDVVRALFDSTDERVRFVGASCVRTFRLRGFARELVAALLKESPFFSAVREALFRTAPSWPDLSPLLTATSCEARLAGLEAAVRTRMPQAFDAAVDLLADTHPSVRARAIEVVVAWGGPDSIRRIAAREGPGSLLALARLGAPEATRRARAALYSPDAAMRRAGVAALRTLDAHDDAARIVDRLDDTAPDVRAEAARVLPHLAGDAIGARLLAALRKETEASVLASLLDGIAETAHADAADDVVALLGHRDERVVAAAARAAGALRLKQAARILVDGRVPGAYEALLQIRPENLVDLLRPHLKAPRRDDRGTPIRDRDMERAFYLLYVNPPGGRELLMQCLKDGIVPDHPVELIRFLCAEDALPWLAAEVEAGSLTVRGAGKLLGASGRRDLADRAVGWLSRSCVAEEGVDFLAAIVAQDKIPEIAALLDGPNERAQLAAWSALDWIGGPQTVEIFRRRIGEGSAVNRSWAAEFLAGEQDVESIPRIEELLDNDDPVARTRAAYALLRLDSQRSFERIATAFKRGCAGSEGTWYAALARTGGAKGRAIVRQELVSARDADVRRDALRALAGGGGFESGEAAFVERYLDDPDAAGEAWDTLLRIDPARVVQMLSDSRHRLWAPQGASMSRLEHAGRVATPLLLTLLGDRESRHRSSAAYLLGAWDVQEAVEPLAAALHAEGADVRRAAAIALLRLGDARGVAEILRLPRRTTVAQGLMDAELHGLNYLRQPQATRRVSEVRWERRGLVWTLKDALEELGRRSGMKVTFSKSIPDHGLRAPPRYHQSSWDLERMLLEPPWNRFAAVIIEPAELRVVTPDEAFAFWEEWARKHAR